MESGKSASRTAFLFSLTFSFSLSLSCILFSCLMHCFLCCFSSSWLTRHSWRGWHWGLQWQTDHHDRQLSPQLTTSCDDISSRQRTLQGNCTERRRRRLVPVIRRTWKEIVCDESDKRNERRRNEIRDKIVFSSVVWKWHFFLQDQRRHKRIDLVTKH